MDIDLGQVQLRSACGGAEHWRWDALMSANQHLPYSGLFGKELRHVAYGGWLSLAGRGVQTADSRPLDRLEARTAAVSAFKFAAQIASADNLTRPNRSIVSIFTANGMFLTRRAETPKEGRPYAIMHCKTCEILSLCEARLIGVMNRGHQKMLTPQRGWKNLAFARFSNYEPRNLELQEINAADKQMNYEATNDSLFDLLSDSIDDYGYELIHLELVGRESSRVLRLFIDAPGGITLDDCAFISQQVGRLLDVEDPIQGRYTLEVSSPGIERPLVRREHYENVVGERIQLSTLIKCGGRKNFLGQLVKIVDDSIVLEADGTSYTIDLTNVRQARLKPVLEL